MGRRTLRVFVGGEKDADSIAGVKDAGGITGGKRMLGVPWESSAPAQVPRRV